MKHDPVNVFDLWVVEYSAAQQEFAVRKFGAALEANLHAFLTTQPNDRVILAFAFSEKLAEEMRRAFDCREDKSKPFTPGHIEIIKELLQDTSRRFE